MVTVPKSRVILAGKPYVLNPYAQMKGQIEASSKAIASVFAEVDAALDGGSSVKAAVRNQKIKAVLNRTIASSRLSGFMNVAKLTGKKMPANYGHQIHAEAETRSAQVARQMRKTSRKVLTNTPDSEHVLSKNRAVAASEYEAGKSFFAGVKDAVRGTGWLKAWVTSASESCDDCMANEDQGPIDVDEPFDSGDDFPTAHLNCGCYATLVRPS